MHFLLKIHAVKRKTSSRYLLRAKSKQAPVQFYLLLTIFPMHD